MHFNTAQLKQTVYNYSARKAYRNKACIDISIHHTFIALRWIENNPGIVNWEKRGQRKVKLNINANQKFF